MLRKQFVAIALFFSINALFGQLNVNINSTINNNCDGFGCEYEGPTILINEVMLKPYPYDGSMWGCNPNLGSTYCRGEWIELYNPDACQWADISCYYLGNAAKDGGSATYPGGFIIPEGTIVPPLGFAIVRGDRAPAVPSHLLVQNGGNVVEIIANTPNRICIGSGYRLWFPNAGGWFAFYDNNGVPQDAISWANNATGGSSACNPGPVGGCGYTGSLPNYNNIPADRKTYINSNEPLENHSYRRVPDGGAWQINSAGTPTYATCNSTCAPPPQITCSGTATASVSGGTPPYTYMWNDAMSQLTQTATGLCAGTYCVTVRDATLTTATACVTIIDNSLTVTASVNPASVCAGESANLQTNYSAGQSPYTVSWTGPSGFTSNNANPSINNAQLNNSGNYLVTVTDNVGCTGTANIGFVVNSNPAPIATNNGPQCVGQTITFSVQNYSQYVWTGPGGFSSSLQNPQISNFQTTQAGVYNLTVTDANGCTAEASTMVEASPSPFLVVESDQLYCEGDNITITSSPAGLTSYQWTGPNSFTSSLQNITITSSVPAQSGTYSVLGTNNYGCTGSASINIDILPQLNATITPLGPFCYNDSPAVLSAVSNGGTWTGNGVSQNMFTPSAAGIGTHTINYSVQNLACSASSQTTVTVYNNISVINLIDNDCNATYTGYTLSFDVVDQFGNPTDFLVNTGSGTSSQSGSFEIEYPSQTSYSITVTDPNNFCDEIVLSGYTDCGCITSAGNMDSYQLVELCIGECSEDVTHNELQNLDADDVFSFILHTGETPLNILASNSTPEFCYHTIADLSPGTTYFISPIAGNGPGFPSMIDPCLSVTQGTPVVWYENPVAHITTPDFSICGLEAEFASTSGDNGVWVSESSFYTTNGTSPMSSEISVMVTTYGTHRFVRRIINGVCIGTDTIAVTFIQTPSAYAGEDFYNCGNTAPLNAILSNPASTGQWSGTGQFLQANAPETEVSITSEFGPHTFTWRETNGPCWSEDQVIINFLPKPNPMIFPQTDSVCDLQYPLSVSNVQGTGQWTAYHDGQLLPISPNYVSGIYNPNTVAIIPNYQAYHYTVEFVWTETFQVAGIECIETASMNVTFAKIPIASVGPVNEAEVCGNSYTLFADLTGSEFGNYSWVSPELLAEFDDPSLPTATITMLSLGSFGDSAHVRSPILWVIDNHGCSDVDTMWVTFYNRPVANAGVDDAVCGHNYTLGAYYSIPETSSYSPSGMWSVHERPDPFASADIEPLNNDTAALSVSHAGIWRFVFRENNSNLPGCYSTDTVTIEFVELPIIFAGEDQDVCGNCTQLAATSGGGIGTWLATPGASFTDYSDPNTNVCSGAYDERGFIYMESNQATTSTLSCTSMDQVIVSFWRVPTANIMTDSADLAVCGLTFPRLRAENPGAGISGYWYNINPATTYSPDPFTWLNASATVPNYGYHDFYWIEETGPEMMPGFCTDTAGPLRIHFIEVPTANAGGDTLFCGYTGSLSAIPSIGTGVWSTPSVDNITFQDQNDPNTQITSILLNADNPTNPCFMLIWTEDNTNECTDKDTICVTFARIPTANMQIIPPKCFGEPATIKAIEDTLGQYTWNFYAGIIDSTSPPNAQGGIFRNFVYWNDQAESHIVSLITTNSWSCQSPIRLDTIYEPPIPDFDVTLVGDTCLIGKGGIIFGDTLQNTSFFWLNEDVGPPYGSPITAVYNIPEGSYYIRTSYLTPNDTHYAYYLSTFGTANCVDTLLYEIEPIGVIDASFEISADIILEDLTAPEAPVIFLNYSDYDDVRKRCEWHFGDGNVLKNCDDMVEYTYTEAGCFTPFLIVMNRDLPECRDTAFLDACIRIDNQSSLEIPNIFSPNADGVNDYFQVKATTLRTFSGTIVNRWGRTVYTWENWKDLDAGWDGNLDGGTKASPGVYYFIIKAEGLDGQPYEEHGALHLMRD